MKTAYNQAGQISLELEKKSFIIWAFRNGMSEAASKMEGANKEMALVLESMAHLLYDLNEEIELADSELVAQKIQQYTERAFS